LFSNFSYITFCFIPGAILFLKVSRIQSFAQVAFSDPILIRYGTGVQITDYDQDDDGKLNDDNDPEHYLNQPNESKCGCPILEFRIVNRMNHIVGGELIDCCINIVASVDAKQTSGLSETTNTRKRRRRRGRKGKAGPNRGSVTRRRGKDDNDDDDDDDSDEDSENEQANIANLKKMGLMEGGGNHGIVSSMRSNNEVAHDWEQHDGPRRVFIKVEPESMDHPFFKRVWLIRHVLNEESPILNCNARDMLKRNNGYWPKELNNPKGIRASIHFDTLVVSFSGLSNADANSVYAQHIYDFGDVSVGYSFCNMLYRDLDDEQLFVDMTLINDVMEQNGGGGEELENAIPKITNMKDKFAMLSL
jgi:hypothetical protein